MTVLWFALVLGGAVTLVVIALIVIGALVRVENGSPIEQPIDPRLLNVYVKEWRHRLHAVDERD